MICIARSLANALASLPSAGLARRVRQRGL